MDYFYLDLNRTLIFKHILYGTRRFYAMISYRRDTKTFFDKNNITYTV